MAPDKFKGSLTAGEVADHLAAGLAAARVSPTTLPLADGGDGSVAAALRAGFSCAQVEARGATGALHTAAIAVRDNTVLVEVANTCGLQTLPDGTPAPLTASSYGLGQAIRHAVGLGAARLVLGLGGSASTDGGVGMLAALGYRFLDEDRHVVAPDASTLRHVHYVDSSQALSLNDIQLIIACDVTNPLLGDHGAAAVFGPQKGATQEHIAALDQGLRALVAAFARSGYRQAHDIASLPGAGAAGGIGFAATVLGGVITSGATYFLDLVDFDTRLRDADLVITGEGRLDHQTLHGKLPASVAQRAAPKPVLAVVGRSDLPTAATPFRDILAVAEHTDIDTSRDPVRTAAILREIGFRIGRRLVLS